MQPFTPLLTRVCTSANFYMQLSRKWIDRRAGVRLRQFTPEKFNLEYNFYTWDHKDPAKSIRDLKLNNFENMFKMFHKTVVLSKDGNSTDCVDDSTYHLYTFGGKPVAVPKLFQPFFLDSKSWRVFRAMMKMFPPYGEEVPEIAWFTTGGGDSYLGEPTYALTPDLSIEKANYQAKRFSEDLAPSGPIALGHNFVMCSEGTIIETETHIFRIALMEANLLHILRGPAWWVQVYHKIDSTLSFHAYGGGKNSLPGVDVLNNHLAGLVFGTMLETYGYVLNETAKSTEGVRPITDGTDSLIRPLLKSLQRTNPELADRRWLATLLDQFSRLGILMRGGLEAVTGPEGLEIGLCADKTADKTGDKTGDKSAKK